MIIFDSCRKPGIKVSENFRRYSQPGSECLQEAVPSWCECVYTVLTFIIFGLILYSDHSYGCSSLMSEVALTLLSGLDNGTQNLLAEGWDMQLAHRGTGLSALASSTLSHTRHVSGKPRVHARTWRFYWLLSPTCQFGFEFGELWLRDNWFPAVQSRCCFCWLTSASLK